MANKKPSPKRERTLALQKRTFDFACAVVDAYPKSPRLDDPSRDTWRQLIRAATSSAFSLEEADAASSDADFLAKMRITLREAKEAHVALKVICRGKLASHTTAATLLDESNQLAAIFFTIVKNTAARLQRS